MSKKVILFLSEGKGSQEHQYTCPRGEPVTGVLTFEAPVKYLLREFPDVSEVLSIVTPVARPNFSMLEQVVRAQAPNVTVTAVPFGEEDFSAGPLAQIMESVKQGDEILLETTGGLRDAIMYLLLVSRALSYSGIKTVGAVYSNFGVKQIVDCSHLIDLFDLVGGMQEMASFGSVRTLREYYQRRKPEPEVNALLDAMERLNEDITLCRTGRIEQRIESFNDALEQAETCSDPLMKALLPAFRAKFDKKLSIPGLIKWCINSDMLQQALTIYKERIPGYILKRNILSLKKNVVALDVKEYETPDEVRFSTQLLTFAMLRNPKRYFHNTDFVKGPRLTDSRLQDILMDYAYIRYLRNKINHASEQDSKAQKALMDCLSEAKPNLYICWEHVKTATIRNTLEHALDNLRKC